MKLELKTKQIEKLENDVKAGKITKEQADIERARILADIEKTKEKIIDKHYVYFATELGKKVARIKYVQYVKEKKLKEGV